MAVEIGAVAGIANMTLNMVGAYDEPATNVILIDGAYDDTETEQALTDLDAISRVGYPRVSISKQVLVSGMSTGQASDDLLSLASAMIVLAFWQEHPLNPAKIITKTVQVRAPVAGVVAANGSLIVAGVVGDRSSVDENLRGYIDWLEDNLAYVAVDDSITVGGWTWDSSKSGLVGSPFIADGA